MSDLENVIKYPLVCVNKTLTLFPCLRMTPPPDLPDTPGGAVLGLA